MYYGVYNNSISFSECLGIMWKLAIKMYEIWIAPFLKFAYIRGEIRLYFSGGRFTSAINKL